MATVPLHALQDEDVLVLGLGAFGGGAGCARALAAAGARVTATDLRDADELRESVRSLAGSGVALALGGHPSSLFRGQLVVVNPAVPKSAPALAEARAAGCTLCSEVELAIATRPELPALAITGTHGKSTAASLAQHLLVGHGLRSHLGGNLGGSLLESFASPESFDVAVLELSSFQTEALSLAPGWPRVAALTGLGLDHLDRHGDAPTYWAAKRRLLLHQGGDDVALLPTELPEERLWLDAARGRVLRFATAPLPPASAGWFTTESGLFERLDGRERLLAPASACPFPERFRDPSYLAAVGGARLLGVPAEAVPELLAGYGGLPHRMQRLPAPSGVTIVDNAVATHPEPTVAALEALPGPLVLLAGGKDKGLCLAALAAAATRCREVHLSGAGGARLAEEGAAQGLSARVYADFRAAATAALRSLAPGDTLLYSPSFASYDEFRNFRDRAEVFQELCATGLLDGRIDAGDNEARTY